MQAQAKATKAKTSTKPSSPKASAKPKGAATTKPSAKLEDSNVQAPAPAARFAEERNGVKPPKRAGLCLDVWNTCADLQASLERVPTAAELAAARPADNANNRSIEYYRYRKWMGVRGRQAKPEPEAAKA